MSFLRSLFGPTVKEQRANDAAEMKAISESFKLSEALAEIRQVIDPSSPLLLTEKQQNLKARLEARLKKMDLPAPEVKTEGSASKKASAELVRAHREKQTSLCAFLKQQQDEVNAKKEAIVQRNLKHLQKQASSREFIKEQDQAAQAAREAYAESEAGREEAFQSVPRLLKIYDNFIENQQDLIDIHDDMLDELSFYRSLVPQIVASTEGLMTRFTLLDNLEPLLLQKRFEAEALLDFVVERADQMQHNPDPVAAKETLAELAKSCLATNTKMRRFLSLETLLMIDQSRLQAVPAKIGTELPLENPAAARADKFPLKQLPGAPISFADIEYLRRDTVLSSGLFKKAKAAPNAEAKVEAPATVALPAIKNPEQVKLETEVRAPSFIMGR